jgi:hypothetical protein
MDARDIPIFYSILQRKKIGRKILWWIWVPFGSIEFLRKQILKTDGPLNEIVFALLSRN